MILRSPFAWSAGLALVGLAAVAGCSGRGRVAPAPVAPAAATATPAQPASTAQLEALYRARADSARGKYTEADVRFVSGMIHHHAQALVMAGWAPTHGAGAPIRTLCARIINAQQDEIAKMQQWLADRALPVPQVMMMNGQLMVHGGDQHDAAMPGMLTPEQMARLDAARGPDFDLLFLRFMIQHHRGAVAMVDRLFATDGAGQEQVVFKLANDVHVDQLTEIARMEKMLASLP